MSPMLFSPDAMAGRTIGESGDLDRPISRVASPVCSQDGQSQENNHGALPTELPKVSFEELAVRYRQNHHNQSRRKTLEHRLHALKVSMGISARFVRVSSIVQRGLVDRLKHDDKPNFVALYHTLVDLQESCDSAFRRNFHRQDPLEEWSPIRESSVDRSPDFFLQLSPQSRSDLLEILHLARTDPQFILERIRALTPGQLTALVSSAGAASDPSEMSFPPPASRSRTHASFSKRSSASSLKDRALTFERTDALSTLLFNVYASPLDSDAPEAQLRLDVWSSVFAKLVSDGGIKYDPLLGHILGSWATNSEWKAKPKFELYLMDILQTGAFLLEHVETPPGMSFGTEPPDPLKTDVAEEFFASAVDALFQLLDDPDGGLPHAVMQLGSAILQKLERQDGRDRFLEFLFVQWFFAKFLYSALTYPEAHGLLLDFHIRKDAREKLLGQVGLRAYSQVFAVLHSMNHYSMARPMVRRHVESMLCRFDHADPRRNVFGIQTSSRATAISSRESPAAFLMLSAADILTLLNALFPRTTASTCNSPLSSSGMPSSPAGSLAARSDRSIASIIEPGFFRPPSDNMSIHALQDQRLFASDMAFLSLPENCMSRNADRIRFELSDLSEPDGRATLEPPAAEEWTIFSMSRNGRCLTWGLFPDNGPSSFPEHDSVDDVQSTTLGMEDNSEALQTAIVKLIQDNPADDAAEYGFIDTYDVSQEAHVSLKQKFDRAMEHCHHDSDFIGAHYWWNAGRQLVRSVANSPSRRVDDSWILEPMHASCVRSLATSRAVIERCETDLVALNRHVQRVQRSVKDLMATAAKLRDKMWYMTDVKHSMRYEDAKHVALALKTMIYSARLYRQAPSDGRSRSSMRPFGNSLLQKPELQVMNIMKAPSSQGGPNKLSDEQVDLIRKWLSHNNIDNFCKGEERIHRFCYEVKTSINRLVGETMAETPVLWSSELYHKERAMYEGSSNRSFLSLSSSMRPFNISSEDTPHASPVHGTTTRPSDTSRFTQDLPPLSSKSSFQSLMSDKWKIPREPSITDASSIGGGSPGRAASTTTGDSFSTFWSTPQPAHYAPSASSLYSRPPSMFSDNGVQPSRRNDRKTQSKGAFLDGLKQTLTSLLLSDLGSPVWSCGSETDAWFGNALEQKRIRTQMKKRARIQQFYTECDERFVHHSLQRTPSDRRRSRSLESADRSTTGDAETPSASAAANSMQSDETQRFSYGTVFRRLIEVFSRHGNPFIKLKALRDLRALVVASLNSDNDDAIPFSATEPPSCPRGRTPGLQNKRSARHSFSESDAKRTHAQESSHTPTTPAAESVIFDSRPSDYCAPTENQIVDALRSLLLEVKPKTLFRDLQFISAFVPSETLNKSDSGTAFLQFGLAALSLKDEICNSMVEIADNIVSQEFSRRHPPGYDHTPRPGHALEDAAGMWIITAKEGNPVAQRELAILYLTHPELLPRVTLPLTLLRDTFKAEMMYRRDKDSKSDPQSMCLALHWMQLSANGGDELARNRLREREEFESIA
ncbi:hypothetical protein BO85DRAFT_3086 [Aspergillus piperis CBS 112811]|uniref:Uncharacterized protein n=1 Tax=Aspergillus piperis CBS 112811 TaxID=1448313 RepID=A0A8G1RBD4_9EURO|nr:hypothetical protein BO85DRAFT_3086 [Aspergillus piperis CBS 112811]RAH62582.1 hypothetical protein BO85DRAFT_3086 [Aspergillus piperis CBS 112811]